MESANKAKILQLFNKLSKSQQLAVFEEIREQTLAQRWKLMDSELPDSDITEDEIMEEVRAIRYCNK